VINSGSAGSLADAVAALCELLPPDTRDRLQALGVFPPDRDIPLAAVRLLWGVSPGEAHFACAELAEAGLLDYRSDAAVFRLHEAIQPQLGAPHDRFLAAIDPGDGAWWELPEDPPYLAATLTWQLAAAGRTGELNRLVTDLRWAARRLAADGPPALACDLAVARAAGGADPAVVALARTLRAEANLFEGVRNPRALAALLSSRLDGIPQLERSVRAYAPQPPCLANRWPPPDRYAATLIRQMTVLRPELHVGDLVARPEGLWVSAVDGMYDEGFVMLWDPRTGRRRRTLDTGGYLAGLLVAPDSTWLAFTDGRESADGRVRLLDATTGRLRAEVPGRHPVAAPDGTWLAVGGVTGEVRSHDTATGRPRWVVTAHQAPLTALLVAPDGTWLASAAEDGTVRISEAHTGRRRRGFNVPKVTMLAVAPGGEWLAAAGPRGVHLIDPANGELRQIHEGDSKLRAVIASGDGSWLAAAYDQHGILVWDAADGSLLHTFPVPGATGPHAVAPDGSWLATTSSGPGDLVILDLTVPPAPGAEPGHADPVQDLEVAPDGSWLATRTDNGEVAHWDAATGRRRRTIGPEPARTVAEPLDDLAPRLREVIETEHPGRTVDQMALSPDRQWLAVLSHSTVTRRSEPKNAQLRVYDKSLARSVASMPAPPGPRGCRWSPDGSALFVWGTGGLHGFTWIGQAG